jgi:hypothetical protein
MPDSTFITAAGPRATRSVDEIEPELIRFVRTAVRRIDPHFPETGGRGQRVRGGWTDDQKVETEFVQVEELAPDGRGLRILRLYRMTSPGPPWDGAVRVIALGMANDARLELRWNFVASATEVCGTSAELTVEGAPDAGCAQDFRSWFDG